MKTKINRRGFIKRIIIGAISLEAIYIVFDLMRSKSKTKENKNLFNAGKVASFENNTMYPFSSAKLYISVLEDGGMLALSVICTHLGCIIRLDDSGFHCPCHASSFDKYGEVKSPPATRALDFFSMEIVNGELMIDIENPIRRKKFEKSQLTFA